MKIGIICEDFKLEKFEQELTDAKIIYTIESNNNGIVAICCISEQHLVKPVVDKVTQHFIDLFNSKLN